jgi:Ca2+-binding EF-hand superfamily protein
MNIVKLRLVGVGLLLGSLTTFANPGLARIHGKMDVNYDGIVIADEFFAFWEADFNRRDKDSDGMLAATDVDAVFMKLADYNKDGMLTWEEERLLRQRHILRMDKDGDGSLTLQEMTGTAP